MSIGFLKRMLTFVKLGAILVIVSAAFGYWDHRSSLGEAWNAPDFRPEVRRINGGGARINDVGMQLGRFQRAKPIEAGPEKAEVKEEILSALAKLGTIKAAVVAYPPYDDMRPALTFEFKNKTMRTIHVGEALEERPHTNPQLRDAGYTVPYRYKFVGCEPDAENPGFTYFLFDMRCDGTDIQKAHWKLEAEEKVKFPSAEDPGQATFHPIVGKGIGILDEKTIERLAKPPEQAAPKPPTQVEPVATPPQPAPTTFTGDLFEDDGGVFAPTAQGVQYLKDNYQQIIKDAQTKQYIDKKTGRPAGLKVVRIRSGSKANAFGIYEDDVILSINDQPVTKQAQAVNIIKRELRKKGASPILRVKILRHGKTIEKRYDTRDPEVRRNARKFR